MAWPTFEPAESGEGITHKNVEDLLIRDVRAHFTADKGVNDGLQIAYEIDDADNVVRLGEFRDDQWTEYTKRGYTTLCFRVGYDDLRANPLMHIVMANWTIGLPTIGLYKPHYKGKFAEYGLWNNEAWDWTVDLGNGHKFNFQQSRWGDTWADEGLNMGVRLRKA